MSEFSKYIDSLSFWYSQPWHIENVSMTFVCSMIEILTHSDSELSNSTEDGESDSELDETGTATLDCVWNFFTRKRILNLMIDNFFGIICKDIIFTE